jgi:uncharacterized protein with NRDE domain
MCTLVILRRPGHVWPLILGANRDEMRDRPWQPPGRHWPDRPEVVAGLDETGGGSWIGVNDFGVTAAILNRKGTLGPTPGKRSRGEIVLDALDHADAAIAAAALEALDPMAYRPFNLVVADDRDAFWLAHRGDGRIAVTEIPAGLSMITAFELNDEADLRVARYRPRFASTPAPDPDADDWQAWAELLDEGEQATGERAMRFLLPNGFGTVSSSILAVPALGSGRRPWWRFAASAGQPLDWRGIETDKPAPR